MPPEATAVYARWWQLETWLRSLVYVERSARDGRAWAESLPSPVAKRAAADQRAAYMATSDATARLAYLDVGPLLDEVIRNDWDLYEGALIEKDVWEGRVLELKRIRNRIGHCRRPHGDDLGRLEQTLRDLEGGTYQAVAAYNRQMAPSRDLDDPVVDAWLRGCHEDARRLLDHADKQYGVRFRLACSRRPWADCLPRNAAVTGTPGYLWHAHWIMAGGRPVDLRSFWNDSYMAQGRDLLVYLTATDPFSIELSFAAVDDPGEIADAIGGAFEAILTNPDYSWTRLTTLDESMAMRDRWTRHMQDLDPKVQVATEWAIVDDSTTPISIFGA